MAALNLTTLNLPHLPPNSHNVHIAVLKDIRNAEHLRSQLLAGNDDYEYAFIDASNIISTKHILVAVFKALRGVVEGSDGGPGGLRTRNVHSEIVFSLSPNNNISESFTRFGIVDKTRNLIAIKVEVLTADRTTPTTSLSADAVRQFLATTVEFGESLPFTDEALYGVSDLETVQQRYKYLAINKEVGVVGKAGIKGRQGKKKSADVAQNTSGIGDAQKQKWGEGGEDIQKDLEVWVIGAMVMKIVG